MVTAALGSAVKATDPSGLTVKVPSKWMCIRILEAAKVPTASIAHSQMVEELATAIVEAIHKRFPGRVDARLVTAGALLHELGAGWRKDMGYIMAGVGLAHRLGLDPRLIEVIRRHKGAGMGYQEAARIGLPLGDLLPRTVEELIVSHADLLVSGDRRMTIEEVVEGFVRAGHLEVADRISKIHLKLSTAAGEDLDRLGPDNTMYLFMGIKPPRKGEPDRGRLLVVEDSRTFERKREYITKRRRDLTALFIGLAVLLIVPTVWLAYAGYEDLAFLASMILLYGPMMLIGFYGSSSSQGDFQQAQVRVYSNGVALRGPMETYHYIPWSDIEVFRWEDKGPLGRVLSMRRGQIKFFLLPTMREFPAVMATVRRNLVEETRWA